MNVFGQINQRSQHSGMFIGKFFTSQNDIEKRSRCFKEIFSMDLPHQRTLCKRDCHFFLGYLFTALEDKDNIAMQNKVQVPNNLGRWTQCLLPEQSTSMFTVQYSTNKVPFRSKSQIGQLHMINGLSFLNSPIMQPCMQASI